MEKNGYGVMKYSNGKIYEGEYKEGKSMEKENEISKWRCI